MIWIKGGSGLAEPGNLYTIPSEFHRDPSMRSPIRLTAIDGGAGGPSERSRPKAEIDSPLREIVTSELRQAILAGRYKPGERLVEDRLAEDFGVSRNPVREALRSLAAEGLVSLTARRGATVAAPSAEDAREMIEVRATLEGYADEAGATNPRETSHQLQILMMGAILSAGRGDGQAAMRARALAELLLERSRQGASN